MGFWSVMESEEQIRPADVVVYEVECDRGRDIVGGRLCQMHKRNCCLMLCLKQLCLRSDLQLTVVLAISRTSSEQSMAVMLIRV